MQDAEFMISIARSLRDEVGRLRFGRPVAWVYNPLEYAWAPHVLYLRQAGLRPKEVVLLGMNPGPWGMAQTGVPFGAVEPVRDWLGIEALVRKPAAEHPKRPVLGFACKRNEVSGMRLWGWARAVFGTPERFFKRFFVANYCPLLFFDAEGRNLTPDRLPARERKPLLDACDRALRRTLEALRPLWVIGLGRFAEERAREASAGLDLRVAALPHPSPASPAANRGWENLVAKRLRDLGIRVP